MKNRYMMLAAAAVLTGVLAGGCGKQEAADANKPATKAEAEAMAKNQGKTMADDKKTDTAMQNMGTSAGAATQKAGDMAHDAGAAMKAEANKAGDKMRATTMPATPGM